MVKEKWSQDPNGEAWARDQDKFGKRMLESMGWTDGKGLGADESGATTHVRVKKRGAKIGLGADINTVDKWAEHVTAFDEILGNLNKSAPNSAPSTAPNSAPNSQPASDSEEPTSKKQKRQKKAKNVYTKFKKHKNMSNLSSADMAHIFGEKKVEEQVSISDVAASSSKIDRSEPEPEQAPVLGLGSVKSSEPVAPVSGLVTVSSMSLSDYFKSKKANVAKSADTDKFQVSSLFSDKIEEPKTEKKKVAPVSEAPKSESVMLTHPSRSLENTSSSTGSIFTIKGSDQKFSKSSKKAKKQRYG